NISSSIGVPSINQNVSVKLSEKCLVAMFVAKLSTKGPISIDTSEPTQERKLLAAIYAVKHTLTSQPLRLAVMFVVKHSSKSPIFTNTREFIQERNPVMCVRSRSTATSAGNRSSVSTWESTRWKSPLSVTSVAKCSNKRRTLLHTNESTRGRNHLSAKCVERRLTERRGFARTTESTREKNHLVAIFAAPCSMTAQPLGNT
uniref:Uncharacterized protein n=1 Tax=Poecilia reticulata TaxID=8081 RepID=A0A3P9QCT2_POERE